MKQVATLRSADCTSLQPLGSALVAACGVHTACAMDPTAASANLATCVIPREATTYALWMPPGAPAATAAKALVVVFSVRAALSTGDEDAYEVWLQWQPAAGGGRIRLALADPPSGPLEALHILHHTLLCVQTAGAAAFYALDPSSMLPAERGAGEVQVPCMGACTFVAGTALHVLAAPGAVREVILVGTAASRVHARVVRVTLGISAVVEASTPPEGLALPVGAALTAEDLVVARVWWPRRELLLLFRNPTVKGARLRSIPLSGASLAWSRRPRMEPELVSASTRSVLEAADDLCCTLGGDVWVVDATTGPTVTLQSVTSLYPTTVDVPGSSTSTKVFTAVGDGYLYLQAGRGLYAMAVPTADLTEANSGPQWGAGQAPKAAEGALSTAASATTAVSGQPKGTLCDWLVARQREQPAEAQGAAAASLVSALLAGGGGAASAVTDTVVRDTLYVTRTAPRTFKHAVLDALLAEDKTVRRSKDAVDRAALTYAAVAHSLHPYSVLLLLGHAAQPQVAGGSNDALGMAIAAYLAQKPTLRARGAFHRMTDVRAASEYYLGETLPHTLAQKRFAAALCRTALSALATGALDAADLLFAVADISIDMIYGRGRLREVEPGAIGGEEGARLEASIADGISVMASYADWALGSASTALGLMTAHLGEPSAHRKEAALPDGLSHPIQTTRTVDIAPLLLPNRSTAGVPMK